MDCGAFPPLAAGLSCADQRITLTGGAGLSRGSIACGGPRLGSLDGHQCHLRISDRGGWTQCASNGRADLPNPPLLPDPVAIGLRDAPFLERAGTNAAAGHERPVANGRADVDTLRVISEGPAAGTADRPENRRGDVSTRAPDQRARQRRSHATTARRMTGKRRSPKPSKRCRFRVERSARTLAFPVPAVNSPPA